MMTHASIYSKAQTALRGFMAPRYQHRQPHVASGVDNEVPKLHATLSEPLE